jgi:heme exporter protein B
MRATLAIIRKDLRIEWRTRETATTLAVLGVLLVTVLAFAHDPEPEAAPLLVPAVLWSAMVFTGLLGVERGFLLEREQDCLAGLRGAPIDPTALYAAKLIVNLLLLSATHAVVVPLTGLFLHVELWTVLPALVLVLLLGTLGFAAVATLFAFVTVRLRTRQVMLPLLVLPLLIPLLIAAVKATEAVLGSGLAGARDALGVLVSFDVIFVTAGALLFPAMVKD